MKVATQPGQYFIPHNAVVKHDGERIEKLRVVFNASASTSSGLSLNDVLIPGPKFQTQIFNILLMSDKTLRIHGGHQDVLSDFSGAQRLCLSTHTIVR